MVAMTDPAPKPRWYRLTPDRFIAGLLALECLLWLCEQCQWLGFSKGRDSAVVLAVLVAGMAGGLLSLWFIGSLLFRRRLQFSIRSLLALTAVIAILFGWLAAEKRNHRAAADEIRALGGTEGYAGGPGGVLIRSLLGNDIAAGEIDYAFFSQTTVTDEKLGRLIPPLRQLQVLTLDLRGQPITDAGLVHLKDFTQLQALDLGETKVTDAGLVYLKGLTDLNSLDLPGTKVTDAGLENLAGMTKLMVLNLMGTGVTDAGFVHFKGLTILNSLYLEGTNVADAGLAQLIGLPNLGLLDLDGTLVTDAGVVHLKRLTNFGWLSLRRTQVTDAGVKEIQAALPNRRIFR
jgi:hypothetical protein